MWYKLWQTIGNLSKLCIVLKGSGENYNTVKIQVLLMGWFLMINRVFSLVFQWERHLNESAFLDTKILIYSVNQYGQRTNVKSNRSDPAWCNYVRERGKNYGKMCSFCNKMNHIANEHYSKHGFPL